MESMKTNRKYTCKSVFVHQPEEIGEAFTELWSQLITEKENANNCQNVVLQTNLSGL